MSRIKELSASLGKKLGALEHQTLQRLDERKRQLWDVRKAVQVDMQKSKDMAAQAKSGVQAKLEHLQAQLALGKTHARDTFEERRTKILKALKFQSVANRN